MLWTESIPDGQVKTVGAEPDKEPIGGVEARAVLGSSRAAAAASDAAIDPIRADARNVTR